MALFAVAAWLKDRGEEREKRGHVCLLPTRPAGRRSPSTERPQAVEEEHRHRFRSGRPPTSPLPPRRATAEGAVRQLNQDIADEYDRVFGAWFGLVLRESASARAPERETPSPVEVARRTRELESAGTSELTQTGLVSADLSSRSPSARNSPAEWRVCGCCSALPFAFDSQIGGVHGSPEVSRCCCATPSSTDSCYR